MTFSRQPEAYPQWQVPAYDRPMWLGKRHTYCVVIPVINEGQRIGSLLGRMTALKIADVADIIIVDAGSTDGSLEMDLLKANDVRGFLIKRARGS